LTLIGDGATAINSAARRRTALRWLAVGFLEHRA